MTPLLAAVLGATLALAQDKGARDETYEFLPPPEITAGDVYRIVAEEKESTWATLYEGSTLLRGMKIGKALSFDASQEVLDAQRGRPLNARWTFARAVETKNDVDKTLRFQGKTVLATEKDGLLLLKYQAGSYLPLEEQKAMRQPVLGLQDRGPEDVRDPVFGDVFSTGRTLKVGEAWTIPVEKAVRLIGGTGRSWSIDEKTSTAKASLASVERRGKALFGRIRTEFDFKVNALEALRFENPIPIRVQMDYVGAIDGSRPDSQMSVKLDFKGVSEARDPSGRKLKVEFDSSFERSLSRKYVTKE
jgi:hypothetical protein